MQDRKIKELKSATNTGRSGNYYSEAIHSFETQVLEKDTEISRLKKELLDLQESTKREQRLMASAWYELGSQLQSTDSVNGSWLKKQRDLL